MTWHGQPTAGAFLDWCTPTSRHPSKSATQVRLWADVQRRIYWLALVSFPLLHPTLGSDIFVWYPLVDLFIPLLRLLLGPFIFFFLAFILLLRLAAGGGYCYFSRHSFRDTGHIEEPTKKRGNNSTTMTGKASGYKRQPTHWPTAPFILIKFFQAICCLVVLLIMIFFGYHLRKDNYSIPWQFVLLTALVRSITPR